MSKNRSINNRKYVNEIKESTPCTDCHEYFPYYMMDFDHISDDKGSNISELVYKSRTKVDQELDKCELVCANCHRIRTHHRGYRYGESITDRTVSVSVIPPPTTPLPYS